jgi:hypothetical protein
VGRASNPGGSARFVLLLPTELPPPPIWLCLFALSYTTHSCVLEPGPVLGAIVLGLLLADLLDDFDGTMC